MRGLGRTFKRGSVWWIAYYHHGKELRESAHSTSERQANRLLKKRLGEMGQGRLVGPAEERVSFDDLARDFITDYEVNGKRSVRAAKLSVAHLLTFFGLDRALDISTVRVRTYIATRQLEGAANASINRELAALSRMFSLAVQAVKLTAKPYIPRLEENNARQGFVDHGSFQALRQALPEYLKDPICFLYESGWRVSEMRALEWRDVDLEGQVLRLRPEVSKNKNGRVLPLCGDLLEIAERARTRRRLDCPFVFHLEGKPIGDFRKAWKKACQATGLSELIVHDLRRTAIRNMIRSGVSEVVAMSLSGHKTRSIFDRYNVVNEADLVEAAGKLQTHLEQTAVTAVIRPLKKAI